MNGSDLFELQTGSWSAGSLPLSLVVIKVSYIALQILYPTCNNCITYNYGMFDDSSN